VRHVGTGILDLRRSVGERQTRIGAIENLLAAMQSRPGDGDPERVAALIAALLLQQALLNIVINAEQVLAGVPGPRRLELRTRAIRRRAVEIRIADSGPGIAADALPRLFEPFFTTKEVGQGTGLGLAIAYGVVQEHKGRLSATNRADGGAVFTLELPSNHAEKSNTVE